jgi:hypothetical protein
MFRILLACAAGLAWAAAAGAQGAEEPTDFERDLLRYRSFFDYGGFEPSLESILPRGAVSRWRGSATVDGTYTDNYGQSGAQRRDAFYSDGSLGVGWLGRTPRLDAVADYRFTTALYQSDAASDRERASHRAAGSLGWQAAERLHLSAGGYLAQNLEQGFAAPRLGVGSNYDNRSDEYGANAGYRWAPTRALSNSGSYAFTYVDYPSSRAEAEGFRRHRASEDLGVRLGDWDSLALGYGFAQEKTLGGGRRRDDHRGTVSWTHTIGSYLNRRRPSSFTLAYDGGRVLYSEPEDAAAPAGDYWSHMGTARYRISPSPRTALSAHAGYQWIVPDEGNGQSSWVGGADADHRLSERTRGLVGTEHRLAYLPEAGDAEKIWTYYAELRHRLSEHARGHVRWEHLWDYQPASARTDATVLTESRRAAAGVEAQLTRVLRGNVQAHYVSGTPRETLSTQPGGRYWQGGGRAELVAELGPEGFLGLEYVTARRQTQESDDDFFLHRGSLFYRRPVLAWLEAGLRYSHERRTYDGSSNRVDYFENRAYASLTAAF